MVLDGAVYYTLLFFSWARRGALTRKEMMIMIQGIPICHNSYYYKRNIDKDCMKRREVNFLCA